MYRLGAGQLVTHNTKALRSKHDFLLFRIDDPIGDRIAETWEFLPIECIAVEDLPRNLPVIVVGFLPGTIPYDAGGAHLSVQLFCAFTHHLGKPEFDSDANWSSSTEPYDPDVDLLLHHGLEAVDIDTGSVRESPPLGGISGCGAWGVVVPSDTSKVWSRKDHIRLVGLEVGYFPGTGTCVRCKRWGPILRVLKAVLQSG